MLLAKSKIICPAFGPFQASFCIFLKLNQFHNFRKGASIFAVLMFPFQLCPVEMWWQVGLSKHGRRNHLLSQSLQGVVL